MCRAWPLASAGHPAKSAGSDPPPREAKEDTVSPRTARSVSTAIVGGVAALVLFRVGIYFWLAVTAWAALADAPEDQGGFKRTLGSLLFGAVMGWAAVVVSLLITVPDGWYWVPRIAGTIAVALFVMESASRVELFSRRLACLLGFASVLGATFLSLVESTGIGRFFGAHLTNPLLMVVIAFVAGAVLAKASDGIARALAST